MKRSDYWLFLCITIFNTYLLTKDVVFGLIAILSGILAIHFYLVENFRKEKVSWLPKEMKPGKN